MSSPSPKTANEETSRAVFGPPPGFLDSILRKDTPMTFEQSLILAEAEADLAFERYLDVFNTDEYPGFLEQLNTEAQLAQQRCDELI